MVIGILVARQQGGNILSGELVHLGDEKANVGNDLRGEPLRLLE